VRDDLAQLVAFEPCVHGHADTAHLGDGERACDQVHRRGGEQPYPVALADTQRQQAVCQLVGSSLQFAVRDAAGAREDERFLLSISRRARIQQVAQRHRRDPVGWVTFSDIVVPPVVCTSSMTIVYQLFGSLSAVDVDRGVARMGRLYVVTGASSGIGAAVAAQLRADGAEVIGIDLRGADYDADLASRQGRADAVEAVGSRTTQVDGVIACAGIARPEPLTLRVNYFGVTEVLEGLLPLLARSPRPRAVALTSVAAIHRNLPDVVEACLVGDEEAAVATAEQAVGQGRAPGIYAASKEALSRWIRRTAATAAWAGQGIALNGVAPGIVDTPMMHASLRDPVQRAELERAVPMPLGGAVRPEEVAAPIRWLASAENAAITGQCVYVDGGADAVLRSDNVW
jgi:NAD(P)-dependent dehydrogenase (short-subunit alcohol dehydrogenase family)